MSACLVLWGTLWIVGIYPGEMTPDSYSQLNQGKAWTFNNAHPAIFSALLGLAQRWTGGVGCVFVAQIVLITAALIALGWSLSEHKPIAKVAFLVLACMPLIWAQWAALWKDVWFSVLILWCIVFLSWRWFGMAALSLVLMSCFRHNAIAFALPLAAYVGFHEYKAGRSVRGAVLGLTIVAGMVLAPKALNMALDVENGYPAAPSFVFDIAGVYHFDKTSLGEGPFAGVVTQEVIEDKYNPDSSRWIASWYGVRGLRHKDFNDDESYGTLKTEWHRVIKEHTRGYVQHRLAFSRSFFGLWDRPQLGAYSQSAPLRKRKREASWLPRTSHRLIDRFIRPRLAKPMTRGWIWTSLALLAGWLAWRRRQHLELAVSLGAGAYLLGNLAIAPSSPVRYHMPTLIMLIFVLPRVLHRNGRPATTRRPQLRSPALER